MRNDFNFALLTEHMHRRRDAYKIGNFLATICRFCTIAVGVTLGDSGGAARTPS